MHAGFSRSNRSVGLMWNRILEFAQRGYHAVSANPVVDVSRSPMRQLMDRSEFDRRIASLRDLLRADESPEVLRDLESPIAVEAHRHAWYQRIENTEHAGLYDVGQNTSWGRRSRLVEPGWQCALADRGFASSSAAEMAVSAKYLARPVQQIRNGNRQQ